MKGAIRMDRSTVARWLEQQLSEMFNWERELISQGSTNHQESLSKLFAHRKWLTGELLRLKIISQ